MTTLTCKNCGKEFSLKVFSNRAHSRQKYCSKSCFYKARTNRRSITCELCGKTVKVNYYLRPRRSPRFCSHSCSSIARLRKYHTKGQVESAIRDLIRKFGHYLTTHDITMGLKIGTGTFTKYGVSVTDMNAQCGYSSHGGIKGGSTFERKVREILDRNYKNVESHVKFKDCVSPKGFPLEFDFQINGEILVEADGNQHMRKDSLLYDPYLAECDRIKDEWCLRNSVRLIRIAYRYKLTENYVMKHLVKTQTNYNVAGNGKRECSKNRLNMDNQQPSRGNVLHFVPRKVQRLIGEDAQSNKPDTSARRT